MHDDHCSSLLLLSRRIRVGLNKWHNYVVPLALLLFACAPDALSHTKVNQYRAKALATRDEMCHDVVGRLSRTLTQWAAHTKQRSKSPRLLKSRVECWMLFVQIKLNNNDERASMGLGGGINLVTEAKLTVHWYTRDRWYQQTTKKKLYEFSFSLSSRHNGTIGRFSSSVFSRLRAFNERVQPAFMTCFTCTKRTISGESKSLSVECEKFQF